MKVPRPSGGSRQSTGVGKIFVKYDNADSARTALQALAGRKFADRTVVTTYFSEVRIVFQPLTFLLANHVRGRKTLRSALGRWSQWLFHIPRRGSKLEFHALASIPFSVVFHPPLSSRLKRVLTPPKKNSWPVFDLVISPSFDFLSQKKKSFRYARGSFSAREGSGRETEGFNSPLEKKKMADTFYFLFLQIPLPPLKRHDVVLDSKTPAPPFWEPQYLRYFFHQKRARDA